MCVCVCVCVCVKGICAWVSSLTCFFHDYCHHIGCMGRHLTWFAHYCTSSCQCRGHFEREEVEWEIPRRYETGHTHWTTACVVGGLGFMQSRRAAEREMERT